MDVEIWSDIACPWCYVGKRRFEAALAQFEHRGQNCSRSVLNDSQSSTRINYKCGAAGFGQTQVDVITPRSLRISTQGISDQLPFNYVIQAHRVGDCDKSLSTPRH